MRFFNNGCHVSMFGVSTRNQAAQRTTNLLAHLRGIFPKRFTHACVRRIVQTHAQPAIVFWNGNLVSEFKALYQDVLKALCKGRVTPLFACLGELLSAFSARGWSFPVRLQILARMSK